jgi:hypothetical protein
MSASHRLAALALAAACLAPAGANAMDDFVRAIGSEPTELVLWGDGDAPSNPPPARQAVVGGVFRSDDKGKNPDTLERDHATLIVNRLDEFFAKKRFRPDGALEPNPEEPKCERIASSTARLFPARPSPDIDNSIR